MTNEIKSCYQALELEPGASLEQVKQAWRELVKVWHPDRFSHDAKLQRKAQERLKDINGAYEVLCQFLASESSPRGSHMNTPDAHGREDKKSRETKTGRGEQPVPPLGHDESKSSKTPKRSKAKVVCLLILAVGVLAYCVHLAVQYRAFTNQLAVVKGIHIGDSRGEVIYRLGIPKSVLGAPLVGKFNTLREIFTVNADKNDENAMPSTTKVEDYSEWVYEEPNSEVRLTIEFNKPGLVESLELYCDSSVRYGWGPIAGIYCGDSEEEVLRLGAPSKQTLDGMCKTIEYSDIGIVVTLTEGRAYIVTINEPQNKAALFWRFMRSHVNGG
jgi:hypothetical protein